MENEVITSLEPKDTENPEHEDVVASGVSGGDEKKAGKKRFLKKLSIYDVTPENDMKYRGPLSYRWLRIIAWITIAFSQYVMLMETKSHIISNDAPVVFGPYINAFIMSLSMPLLLIAAFALLLNGHGNFKRQFMINGGVALGFIIVYLIIYQRYVLGFLSVFFENKSITAVELDNFLSGLSSYKGYVAFNIFLDIFLCTLLLYFLAYNPKKYFDGKKIYVFRSFALLPILYEAGCIVLKLLAANKTIVIPVAAYPFLTTKPPLSFLMFFAMVLFIKNREKRFLKHGKTHEEYREFLKTNTNSFHFSLFMAGIILLFSFADLVLFIVLVVVQFVNSGIPINSITDEMIRKTAATVYSWGFNGMDEMFALAPIMLLFSYTRTHKNPLIDTAIPIVGVVVIIFVYIEGILDIVRSIFSTITT